MFHFNILYLGLSLSLLIIGGLFSKEYPLSDLKNFADTLNMEGGYIARQLKPNQIWVNIATVLDRPFINGIEWLKLTQNSKYHLKEASISDYNEPHNYYAQLTFIKYYVDNGHRLVNKLNNQDLKIIVHVHRGVSGIKYLNLFSKIFEEVYDAIISKKNLKSNIVNELFSYNLSNNVAIHYRYGYPDALANFEDADIVISVSLVAGFNERIGSGEIVLPNIFLPMDLDKLIFDKNKAYEVKNYAIDHLEEIIKSQNLEIAKIINTKFVYENRDKLHHKANKLSVNDFTQVKVIHANETFNPSKLPKFFTVV